MFKLCLFWLTFLILLFAKTASACVCFSGTESGIKESQVVLRAYIESAGSGVATARVIKVYKGIVSQVEIKFSFVGGNGFNCGTGFQAGKFETIALNVNYSEDGTKFGYYMPECSFDGVRNAIASQPILDAYLLEIEAFETKCKQNPNSEKPLLNYLAKVEESKDYLRAIDVLGRLQKIKPDNLDYQAQAAFWWLQFGKLKISKAIFDTILAKEDQNLSALRGRDQVLIFEGKGTETKGNLKDYSNMRFYKVDYSNLDMSEAKFYRAKDDYEDKFDHTIFDRAQFIDSQFEGSFKAASFNKTVIENSSLRGDFTAAKLSALTIKNSRINYSKFLNAEISNVDFADTDLSGTDFTGAHLKNVDFSKADITNAKFNNVECDKKTKWPTKFDPEKHLITCNLL